jgi:hypothetical protein
MGSASGYAIALVAFGLIVILCLWIWAWPQKLKTSQAPWILVQWAERPAITRQQMNRGLAIHMGDHFEINRKIIGHMLAVFCVAAGLLAGGHLLGCRTMGPLMANPKSPTSSPEPKPPEQRRPELTCQIPARPSGANGSSGPVRSNGATDRTGSYELVRSPLPRSALATGLLFVWIEVVVAMLSEVFSERLVVPHR